MSPPGAAATSPTVTSLDDVTAAARAWTGHSIDWKTYQYKFYAGEHDAEAKSFMGQSRNWDGPDIVDHVLQENTAKKLVAWILSLK